MSESFNKSINLVNKSKTEGEEKKEKKGGKPGLKMVKE